MCLLRGTKGNLALTRRPRERYPSKRPSNAGAVIIHVPLPGVSGAVVHKRGMESGRGSVREQEGNGVASNRAAPDSLRIEGVGASVVEPEARVVGAARISPEQNDGLVRGLSVGPRSRDTSCIWTYARPSNHSKVTS